MTYHTKMATKHKTEWETTKSER